MRWNPNQGGESLARKLRNALETLYDEGFFVLAVGISFVLLVAYFANMRPTPNYGPRYSSERWCDYEAGVVCWGSPTSPSCLPWSQVEPVCAAGEE
jgi:hypothetical protein